MGSNTSLPPSGIMIPGPEYYGFHQGSTTSLGSFSPSIEKSSEVDYGELEFRHVLGEGAFGSVNL
jgi:hypothetical protein